MKTRTKRQLFDRIARHLLKQGKRSMSEGGTRCAYHGSGGRRCAVGCLIPPRVNTEALEGKAVAHDDVRRALRPFIGPLTGGKSCVLERLQAIHDNADPQTWQEGLRMVAEQYGFLMPKVTR